MSYFFVLYINKDKFCLFTISLICLHIKIIECSLFGGYSEYIAIFKGKLIKMAIDNKYLSSYNLSVDKGGHINVSKSCY